MFTVTDIPQLEGEVRCIFPDRHIYIRIVEDGYMLFTSSGNTPTVFKSTFIDGSVVAWTGMDAFIEATHQLIEQEDVPPAEVAEDSTTPRFL